jgi:diguanylate cyclase (GGDEF)-like protein
MRTDLLFDQLAELAGHRSRDGLEAGLLQLFNDLFVPRQVAVYRLMTRGARHCWVMRRLSNLSDGSSTTEPLSCPDSPELQSHRASWHSGQTTVDPLRPTLVLVPMQSDNETQCLVEIDCRTPLDDHHLRLIHGAQRFYRHLQELVNENERDALTRLLNRKSFDQNFLAMAVAPQATLVQASKEEPPGGRRMHAVEQQRCWLAIVDIDHFKRVNDTFGHLLGDEVLILVSRLLRDNFRSDDRLYRFGGEEFVVMLNTPRGDLAARALERLRQKIENFNFPRVGHLTVSIGFTEVKASDTPNGAFERADECVYHAKSHGRNQTVAYDSLLKSHIVETPQPASEVEFF